MEFQHGTKRAKDMKTSAQLSPTRAKKTPTPNIRWYQSILLYYQDYVPICLPQVAISINRNWYLPHARDMISKSTHKTPTELSFLYHPSGVVSPVLVHAFEPTNLRCKVFRHGPECCMWVAEGLQEIQATPPHGLCSTGLRFPLLHHRGFFQAWHESSCLCNLQTLC